MVDILLTFSCITIFQPVWYSSFVNIILHYDLITLHDTWPSLRRRLQKPLPNGIPVHEAEVEYSCSFKHASICRGIHRIWPRSRLTRFVNNRRFPCSPDLFACDLRSRPMRDFSATQAIFSHSSSLRDARLKSSGVYEKRRFPWIINFA